VVKLGSFWHELKRRNVLRAGVLYAAAAWLLVQVATQVFPFFHIHDWVIRWIVVACIIGAPFWLALAWFYELTPEGLKRESEIAPHESISRRVGRRLDYAIIGVLSVVVVVLAANALVWRKGPGLRGGDDVASVLAKLPQQSLAVLPLDNDGGDKDEQFFSDGISEDLITALSQFAGLKVIGRNSAFQFRHSQSSPAEIAAKLGVAHLLEGSVKRDHGQVRIRVELVKAVDGSTVWSQRYTRPYRDLFKLQDEITASVAQALKAQLLEGGGAVPQSDRPPGDSLDAYAAYLRGNAFYAGNNEADLRRAVAAYAEAIRLDPHYAAAYAQTSMVWTNLANQFLSGDESRVAFARARAVANIALGLDANLAIAHSARGLLLDSADYDWYGARDEYQRALQLSPQDSKAQFYLASLLATLGEVERAVDLTRQSVARDPRNVSRYDWLAGFLIGLGRLDEAQRAIETAIAMQPDASGFHSQLAMIQTLRGNEAAALAEARLETPGPWRNIALTMAMQIGADRATADEALQALIRDDAETSAYQIAQIHALRNDAEHTFEWLDRAWANRDSGIVYLLYDPFIMRYRDDARLAAFCAKVGLPAPAGTRPRTAAAASDEKIR
jgi:TolB-like protein/Flp pilus assembly protein TadD